MDDSTIYRYESTSWCSACGKVGFDTKDDAQRELRRLGRAERKSTLPGERLMLPRRAYACWQGWWHITKLQVEPHGRQVRLLKLKLKGLTERNRLLQVQAALISSAGCVGAEVVMPPCEEIARHYGRLPVEQIELVMEELRGKGVVVLRRRTWVTRHVDELVFQWALGRLEKQSQGVYDVRRSVPST